MSYGIFVTVPGVPGVTTVKDQKDKIEALTFDYGVTHPHQLGLSSGERVHSDVTITKSSDKASALLMLACAMGKHYESVKFEFYRVDRGAAQQLFATITIKNAIVSSWRVNGNGRSPSPELEETVSFAFQEIEMTVHGSQASDSFRVNPGAHS
jgi:type VI secretion system Hcp family effector